MILDRLKQEINETLGNFGARELAYHFMEGSENARMIYRNYLETKSESFTSDFREHLEDPLLGERDDDDF